MAAAVAAVGAGIAYVAGAVGTGVAAATAGTAIAVSAATATAVASGAITGMLVGGVIGAGMSAITGGDILKGVLTGAVLGAVTGGYGAYADIGSSAISSATAASGGAEAGAAAIGDAGSLANVTAESLAGSSVVGGSEAGVAATMEASAAMAGPVGEGVNYGQGLIGAETGSAAGQTAGQVAGQAAVQATPGGSAITAVNAAQEGLSKSEMLFANALKENSANMWKSTLLQTGAGFLKGAFEPDQSDLMKEKAGYELANFEAMKNMNQAGAIGASGLRKYRALQSFSDKYKAYLAATLQKPTTSVSGSVAGNRGLLQTA